MKICKFFIVKSKNKLVEIDSLLFIVNLAITSFFN